MKRRLKMYKCKYFKLYELLPKSLYEDEDTGWELIDERLLRTIDFVRELLGVPLTVNTWKQGGSRGYSCARTPDCKEYSKGSYHSVRADRKVMACDMVSNTLTAAEMRKKIKDSADSLPYPIRLENGVAWLHVDVAEKTGYKIYVFNA